MCSIVPLVDKIHNRVALYATYVTMIPGKIWKKSKDGPDA